jgi:hypothetical protein
VEGEPALLADGSAKQSLVAFLQEITQGPGALPVADRVAAFDNDGTLACEKPHTALAGFLLDRAAAAGSAPPEVASAWGAKIAPWL